MMLQRWNRGQNGPAVLGMERGWEGVSASKH